MAENNVTQWEYQTICDKNTSSFDFKNTMEALQKAGEEGWETTGNKICGNEILMRRPKQQKTPSRDEEDLFR